jgi:hypothetical protein
VKLLFVKQRITESPVFVLDEFDLFIDQKQEKKDDFYMKLSKES